MVGHFFDRLMYGDLDCFRAAGDSGKIWALQWQQGLLLLASNASLTISGNNASAARGLLNSLSKTHWRPDLLEQSKPDDHRPPTRQHRLSKRRWQSQLKVATFTSQIALNHIPANSVLNGVCLPLEADDFNLGRSTCLFEELAVSSWGRNQLEAKLPGLFSDSGFDTDAVRRLIFHPDGFFVGAPGRQHVINDPGYFVRGGGDGFRSPEFRAHPAKVMPQVALAPI
jgi:hypothetical protein